MAGACAEADFSSIDKRAMISAAGLPFTLSPAICAFELAIAAITLCLWRWRPFFKIARASESEGMALAGKLAESQKAGVKTAALQIEAYPADF